MLAGDTVPAMPTALVVDDDETTREFLRHYLAKMNVTAVEAEDGKNALAVLAGVLCDVIITDLEMPVMGGLELIEALKVSRFRDTPVLVLSAHPEMIERALQMGVNGALTKPIRYAMLEPVVRRLMGP